MSDNISRTSDGIDQFYSLREPAWHRLGHVSETVLPIADAVIAAGMDHDWSVSDSPLSTTVMDLDGVTSVELPDKHAVIRTNRRTKERRAFGPVSSRYAPHPIEEVFSFADELQGGGAVIETLGSLGRGEREFITMKLPHSITVGGKDKTNMYLFGSTGFDGSTATNYDITGVRVVCANTWKMAKANSTANVKFRHTSMLDISDVEKARRLLELSLGFAEDLQSTANRLLGVSLRDEDAATVLSTLFPFPDEVTPGMKWDSLSTKQQNAVTKAQTQRQQVFTLYKSSPAQAEPDTGWGLFNGLSEWTDHVVTIRGDEDGTRQAEKILMGEFDGLKDRMMNLLLA